jgi:hypothetical protein
VPAVQTSHALAATDVVVEPGLHRVHAELTAAEKVPNGHGLQDDDPVESENVPASHGAQYDELLAPTANEYIPALQAVHKVVPRTEE